VFYFINRKAGWRQTSI